MIVVAVAVVESDHDRHAFPLTRLLECVDCFHEEHLFVQRIGNAARMPGLIALRLDVAHSGQVVGLCGGYNASILREASQRIRQLKAEGVTLVLELSGKRPVSYFRYQGVRADKTFTHFEDRPRFDEVEVLANRYRATATACGFQGHMAMAEAMT